MPDGPQPRSAGETGFGSAVEVRVRAEPGSLLATLDEYLLFEPGPGPHPGDVEALQRRWPFLSRGFIQKRFLQPKAGPPGFRADLFPRRQGRLLRQSVQPRATSSSTRSTTRWFASRAAGGWRTRTSAASSEAGHITSFRSRSWPGRPDGGPIGFQTGRILSVQAGRSYLLRPAPRRYSLFRRRAKRSLQREVSLSPRRVPPPPTVEGCSLSRRTPAGGAPTTRRRIQGLFPPFSPLQAFAIMTRPCLLLHSPPRTSSRRR